MYITHIEAEFPGAHAFFPKWNEAEWKKTLLFSNEIDEKHKFSFDVYQYDRIT
jgi:dihydrofolate reductase